MPELRTGLGIFDRSRAAFRSYTLPRPKLPASLGGRLAVCLFAAGILLRCWLMYSYRPAFLGIADSGTYMQAAHLSLFLDPVHPAGYALFLRVLHWPAGSLYTVTLLQHAMGVLTALLLFELGRFSGSIWAGLLAAAVVLLNGMQLWVEHTPLSDSLFTFLCTAALYLMVRAREGGRIQLVLLGLTLGAATIVRTVSMLLFPLAALWLLWTVRGPLIARAVRAAAALVVAVAVVGSYVAIQYNHSGVFGFTESDGRIEYAVAAQFADCSKFTPPPHTRALCQATAPRDRGSFNQYLWGFPDGASQLPPGGRAAVSPAWRLYGPMPGGNSDLGAFGRAAIVHQPGALIAQSWRNLTYYWKVGGSFYIDDSVAAQPGVAQAAAGYYGVAPKPAHPGFGPLLSYARAINAEGIPILILLIASVSACVAPRRRARAIGTLAGAAGWLLLGGATIVAWDPRYALPAIGPLALATGIGVSGIVERLANTSPCQTGSNRGGFVD